MLLTFLTISSSILSNLQATLHRRFHMHAILLNEETGIFICRYDNGITGGIVAMPGFLSKFFPGRASLF